MAKGKDKQKSSEKKKPLKTLLEKRKDKKEKKDKAFWQAGVLYRVTVLR